jgi:hypothetical protein
MEMVVEVKELVEGGCKWALVEFGQILMLAIFVMAVFLNSGAPPTPGFHRFLGLVPSAEETVLSHGGQRTGLLDSPRDSVIAWEPSAKWGCADYFGVCRELAGALPEPEIFCQLSAEPGTVPVAREERFNTAE